MNLGTQEKQVGKVKKNRQRKKEGNKGKRQGDLLFVLTDRSPRGTLARQMDSRTERLWNKLP